MFKMCGIFLYFGDKNLDGGNKKCLCNAANKIIHRGPDQTKIRYYSNNVMTCFHRLAIVDPTPSGIQPFESKDGRFVSISNGEIYNYKQIKKTLFDSNQYIEWKTRSDCEVIVHMFNYLVNKNNTVDEAFKILCRDYLDGEYSLIIYDHKTDFIYYATDELSMRPLFIGKSTHRLVPGYFIASEQKCIIDYCSTVTRLKSGTYGYINPYKGDITFKSYFDLSSIEIKDIDYESAVEKVKELLIENVKRKLNPDREYVFLLSGGLDSSLVCSIASKLLYPTRIRTFTVGFSEDATDVLAARKVASHIDSIHEEFIFTYEEGIKILPYVIKYNESWDQTSTRASIPMSLCVKKIREIHPSVAVIFSGEVADELFRGYLYNRKTPSLEEGRKDQIMRLKDIYMFDGLRADRVCSSHSMEARFPFFGKDLIKFVLSLPNEYIDPGHNNGIEKYILRKAFDKDEYLPHEILWRVKNALSDASSVKSGWKDYLKRYCQDHISDSRFNKRFFLYPYCTPQTKEDFLYREIFNEFKYDPTSIAYKWMSSWCDPNATDSSASTIDVFVEDDMK